MTCLLIALTGEIASAAEIGKSVQLPVPKNEGTVSVEQALHARRSIRAYTADPITLEELSQLLWAAQGITDARGRRTTPSAGALYALEVYVIAGNVTGLDVGLYRYVPKDNTLVLLKKEDLRQELGDTSTYNQAFVTEVPVDLIISGIFERISVKYGERGIQYTYMEAGHASQNVYLQAVALGLGTVSMGAFVDDDVKELVGMAANEQPLYVMPLGHKKE